MNLEELFIVSAVALDEAAPADAITANGNNYPDLTISVTEAPGTKCPRCWMQTTEADENGLCPRCHEVISDQ